MQVPAGTVRPGEDPADAVLRETREETGHDCFAVRRFLGVEEYRVAPARDETHVRRFFHLDATAPLPETWQSAERHDGRRAPTAFTCWWLPVERGHVLAAGLGARLADLTGY